MVHEVRDKGQEDQRNEGGMRSDEGGMKDGLGRDEGGMREG